MFDPDAVLIRLGYSFLPDAAQRRALFARDVGAKASHVDGELARLLARIPSTIPHDAVFARCRVTRYWVATEDGYRRNDIVPLLEADGTTIARVPAAFLMDAALEGTGRLIDGRIINVVKGRVDVRGRSMEWSSIVVRYAEYARRRREAGATPHPSQVFGVEIDGGSVVAVQKFRVFEANERGVGFGINRGRPYRPFNTIATDIGAYSSSDPRFKGKGGLIPLETNVLILEAVGRTVPTGAGAQTTDDGWRFVHDTGGAIFGAHIDEFVGTLAVARTMPGYGAVAHIWFDGIEERMRSGYSYGLEAQ